MSAMPTTGGSVAVAAAYERAERSHAPSADYPQLNIRVFFVGSCFLGGAIQLFAKAGCTAARSIEEADLVVFLGGADVDPALYGERCLSTTGYSAACDARDLDAFAKAMAASVPMFGICRGMQFLHVMNGGKLYQDVRNHTYTHDIIDNNGTIVTASSMHHQMCIENDTTFALAYATEAGHGHTYAQFTKHTTDPSHNDLEAAVYPDIDALAVQGHPEVGGYPEYSAWCLTQIAEYLDERRLMGSNSKPFKLTQAGRDAIDPTAVPPAITPNTEGN